MAPPELAWSRDELAKRAITLAAKANGDPIPDVEDIVNGMSILLFIFFFVSNLRHAQLRNDRNVSIILFLSMI